jgi:RNA polymerase sigma factor (sigma-70 family)
MSPRISIRLLSGQTDERLLALTRAGHERAFEALVERYRRPLLRFCRRTMRLSDARAEDVVQQSLVKAWMALAGGTEVRDFKPWLYSIVRNTALNSMRGAAEGNVALTDAVPGGGAAVDFELEQRLEMRDALTHVAALPQAQREAIFLTAIDGQSHDEAASAMGITNGAVRGLLYRARTTLRRAAAAITPQPLIAWAAGGSGGGSSAERIAEATSGAGAIGVSGLVVKGAAIAVTAGALATSAVVHFAHPSARHERSAGALAASARTAGTIPSGGTASSGAAQGSGVATTGARAGSQRSAGGSSGSSHPRTGAPSRRSSSRVAPGHRPAARTRGGTGQTESSPNTSGSAEPESSATPQPSEAVATAAGTTMPTTSVPASEPPPPPPSEKGAGGEPAAPGGGAGGTSEKEKEGTSSELPAPPKTESKTPAP